MVWQSKGQQLGRILTEKMGLAYYKYGLDLRVMGSAGSTFSFDPAAPGVGKGCQRSDFRDGHIAAVYICYQFF